MAYSSSNANPIVSGVEFQQTIGGLNKSVNGVTTKELYVAGFVVIALVYLVTRKK